MKPGYQLLVEEALERMQVTKEGLSSEQVEAIRSEKGENVLQESQKKTVLQVFLAQFKDLLVVILVSAALLSGFSGHMESTIVILAVILLNAILGTLQHVKAQKSLESLKSLSSPSAKVLRNGRKIEVPSREIVPGDILMLEAGDIVVADGRIINNFSLQVNESSLTGESTNVDKSDGNIEESVPLGDRVNMVYSGSLVTYGRANVVVTEIGMETEIGKIASLMNETKEKKTPLQVSLDNFSRKLAIVIIVISVIVFALNVFQEHTILESLMFAIALAVAAIPEALSSIVTIVQAMGVQKMAKENAIIKELKAVESLGSVSVICSDKTGTLTQNKMTVQEVYVGEETLQLEEIDLKNQLHRYLMYNAILTNDATIHNGVAVGDPTEYALLAMARKIQLQDEEIRKMMKRVGEIPFDSDRKLMSTQYNMRGIQTVLTKGAVDVLLERSVAVRTNEGVRPMSDADKKQILDKNHEFSEKGLRVLAFAYKEVEDEHILKLESEMDYVFIGLISMVDPPREESKKAVADAKRAGIKPVMITGDHKVTAVAIAKQIGIFEEEDLALTGAQLDALSEAALDAQITKISVYARVSPENKIRIVTAWQRFGHIVAMTGDGVNDAPALKKADIGVAMGITGTEVSKDAAAMILSDDNFATIIKSVANGRNVYRNIKNAIQFLLSGNMAGILSVLYTSILALPIPFQAVHLLFINLLTDSLPAIAIGMEPAEANLLDEKPRNPKTSILTKDYMTVILIQGGLIAMSTMIAFHIGLSTGNEAVGGTMAFATLALARLFHGFNCRSSLPIFKIGFKKNVYSIYAFLLGILFLTLVLTVPFLHDLFEVAKLTGNQLGMMVGLAIMPTVLIQIGKVVKLRFQK